jgi:hypothetical protein
MRLGLIRSHFLRSFEMIYEIDNGSNPLKVRLTADSYLFKNGSVTDPAISYLIPPFTCLRTILTTGVIHFNSKENPKNVFIEKMFFLKKPEDFRKGINGFGDTDNQFQQLFFFYKRPLDIVIHFRPIWHKDVVIGHKQRYHNEFNEKLKRGSERNPTYAGKKAGNNRITFHEVDNNNCCCESFSTYPETMPLIRKRKGDFIQLEGMRVNKGEVEFPGNYKTKLMANLED